MKNILAIIGLLIISLLDTNAQDRNKAFGDSLIKDIEDRVKAATIVIEKHKGFELIHDTDAYYFSKPGICDKYMGRGVFSGEPTFSWRQMSLNISDEDLLYSYLKPFTKWVKMGQECIKREQPDENYHSWPYYIWLTVFADMEGNIQTIHLTFHESMPIPYEECLAFYNRMNKGKLKINIVRNKIKFQKAKWLTYDFKIDLRKPEQLKKLEAAPWPE
jgi:hypothetical protein